LFVVVLTAFRLSYYGLPLPNTFFAKVGGIPVARGVEYLSAFLVSGGALLAAAALPALIRDRRLWGVSLYIAATTAFVVRIGGDVFGYNRFFLPAFALLAAVAVRSLQMFQTRGRSVFVGLLAVMVAAPLLAFASLSADLHGDGSAWYLRRRVALQQLCEGQTAMRDENRTRALRIEGDMGDRRDDSVVAAAVIGALGWYGRFTILDLFGLTNTEIAGHEAPLPEGALILPGHQRSNADYVMSRAPEFVVIGKDPTGNKMPAILDLGAHPDFQALYQWEPTVSAHRRKSFP
jgi:hypothetical protein